MPKTSTLARKTVYPRTNLDPRLDEAFVLPYKEPLMERFQLALLQLL